MARSVNKVILLGNLGRDPELKYTANGQAYTRLNLATSERWKDKNTGDWQERTEWHTVVCWARLAEFAGQYLTKGSSVYVEGKLQTRMYEKEGQKHYSTEVVAMEMVLTGGRPQGGDRQQAGAPAYAGRPAAAPAPAAGGGDEFGQDPYRSTEITDDDIPF